MESYGRFAGVYDVFMDNVNYREWADSVSYTHLTLPTIA